MSDTTYGLLVRDGMDWAEFFVNERQPVQEGDHTRYSVTWACVSSYGVFGHHWAHMGSPFPEFAARTGPDYLLGKIARQTFDADKFAKWIRREIFTSRATREQKSAASAAFRRLRDEHGDNESLAALCYADDAISHCRPEWSDCESRSHDRQAVMFVEKMWPKFVAELSARSAVTT